MTTIGAVLTFRAKQKAEAAVEAAQESTVAAKEATASSERTHKIVNSQMDDFKKVIAVQLSDAKTATAVGATTAATAAAAAASALLVLQGELVVLRTEMARLGAEALAYEKDRAKKVEEARPQLVDENGKEVHAEKPAPVVLAEVDPAAIRTLTAASIPAPPETPPTKETP